MVEGRFLARLLSCALRRMAGGGPLFTCRKGVNPSAVTRPAAKKAAKGRPKKTDAPAPPEGENVPGDLGQVLAALKANGVADTAMAERLGVSRSTYTNYCKGKTVFAPDDEQVATVRGEVILRANELLAALAVIDGTEQMAVS